jgi:cyclopropane-fatty-acyl-phospholipid synthase
MASHLAELEVPPRRTGASPEAIISHYDKGEDFFQLFLDPDMVYSCALFEAGDDLQAAQRRKLDHHIEAAGAANAKRVLEIGCGWGGLLRRLTGHYGVEHAVGLTLSPSQANWIRKAPRNGMEVIEQDWRDHKPPAPYDAIISIAAFEAFVHKGMSPSDKLDGYREFFKACARMLKPGGRLSLQTIALTKPMVGSVPLIEETFPESDLPLVWEPIAAAEQDFRLIRLQDDAAHYEKTLQIWEDNLKSNFDKAIKLIGEPAADSFRRYLKLSRIGFKHGVIGLLRMSFVKRD